MDPLDILVLTERNLNHGGILVNARPIGGLRMFDGDEVDDITSPAQEAPPAAWESIVVTGKARTHIRHALKLQRRSESINEAFDLHGKLLAEGKTSRDISKYLSISLKTAMTHRTHIMEKLAMHSRSEIMRYAIRKAIIPPEEV